MYEQTSKALSDSMWVIQQIIFKSIDSPIGKLLPDEEPDDVETNEVRELVRTTLNSLPRKARQVADMMQEGRTTEEMTERLQITDGALYAHTFRIRNAVTSTLRKNGYMEGPVRRTRDRGTREGSAVLLLLLFESLRTSSRTGKTVPILYFPQLE